MMALICTGHSQPLTNLPSSKKPWRTPQSSILIPLARLAFLLSPSQPSTLFSLGIHSVLTVKGIWFCLYHSLTTEVPMSLPPSVTLQVQKPHIRNADLAYLLQWPTLSLTKMSSLNPPHFLNPRISPTYSLQMFWDVYYHQNTNKKKVFFKQEQLLQGH